MSGERIRRKHTKSRKGCIPCKQRHAKCDEERPQCANCCRLDTECKWPQPPRSTPPNALSPFNDPTLYCGDGDTLSIEPCLPLRDFALLHHWTTRTYLTLNPAMSTQVNIWRDTVVEMGMTHHFLLHGIFALTAVHRATLGPGVADSKTLLQADHHISHALGPYRGLLLEPTPEVSPSMFVFSTILSIYTLGSAQLQPAEDPIQTVIQCFRMVRGCSQAIGQNFETITNSEIKPLVENALFDFETMIQPGVPQIHLLLELIKGKDQSSVCVEAAEHLHKVFFHIQQCALLADSDRSTVAIMFTWPTMLAEDFIRLLCDREPISLVVLAHFAVLLCEHHSHWWLGDLGSRVITAIQSRLGSMGGIDEWLAWPLRIAQPQLSH